jgi:DNA-binding response OmpR family regulator
MKDRDDSVFVVGEWSVAPALNQIDRAGQSTSVPPKVMDLLVYLTSRALVRTEHFLFDRMRADSRWKDILASVRKVETAP